MKPLSAISHRLFAAVLAVAPVAAFAVDSDPAPPVSNEHAAGRKAIEAKDWNGAIKSLRAAVRRDSRNADIHNLLGYAYRSAGQAETAFKHYYWALQIDPQHRGAHDYIGEAYLTAGPPAHGHFLIRHFTLCHGPGGAAATLHPKTSQIGRFLM